MNVNKILERIEDNGFEAYIVGGYVRDFILGIESTDIDICTNAKVKEILDIFSDVNVTSNEYGAVKMITNNAKIDITTYRRDLRYNGSRRKVEMEYVDNLIDDIQRRDFTMNTLCMSKEGNIIDVLGGKQDIEDKIVRCVGDINERINEDPLRMLRAVRFATVLGFKIEENLYEELKNNKELLEALSMERIKEELTKILIHKNAIKGLDYLRRLGFLPYLGIEFDNIVNVPDVTGMYSQLTFTKEYPFSKEEKNNIDSVKAILENGEINKEVLFNYGLYLSLVAGSILGVSKEYITELDKKVSIRHIKDIDLKSDEICDILGINPGKVISEVYSELKIKILRDELENTNEVLRKYVIDNRKKWLHEGDSKKGFNF